MGLTKDERMAGYRPVPQPNEQQVAILRRVALGFLLVTQGEKGPVYTYDDGSPLPNLSRTVGNERSVKRMIAEGWLMPIEGEALPFHSAPTPPQRYRARTVEDGALPRFVKVF